MFSKTDEKLINYAMHPETGMKITVIGGGTGLATLLRGLKLYSNNITAIVTVADNGGSSGMLREDLKILPPGDIRNCILALADTEPLLSDLFNHRFTEGRLSGQSFGNLFIAAMNAISENFYDAVRNVSHVLAVKGRVLPVSLTDIQIGAKLKNGNIVIGENEIGHRDASNQSPIESVFMSPQQAKPLPDAIAALRSADLIVLGPGSLYTSIIPNLLFHEIADAIDKSHALKMNVANIMTQPAETDDYDAAAHIKAVLEHVDSKTGKGFIDYCVVNDGWIDPSLIEKYRLENAVPVVFDKEVIHDMGIRVISAPLACVNNGVIRHDHTMLAKVILRQAIDVMSSCTIEDASFKKD